MTGRRTALALVLVVVVLWVPAPAGAVVDDGSWYASADAGLPSCAAEGHGSSVPWFGRRPDRAHLLPTDGAPTPQPGGLPAPQADLPVPHPCGSAPAQVQVAAYDTSRAAALGPRAPPRR